MKGKLILTLLAPVLFSPVMAQQGDSITHVLDNITITGTRNQTDIRHLPMTLTIVDRKELAATQRLNVLPTLAEQVPGLFVTQRGMLGFGVSGGAAGEISLRGLSAGSGQVMVLIDGHPQYQGIFGHSISDAYQTMMAERVEVLRGPASMLYGSNAMGGVVNIVTRKMNVDGVRTDINLSGGSYGTAQAEFTNRIKSGRFSSVVAGQYARSDNNRPRMGFEQYGGYVKLGYEISKNWSSYADLDLTHFNASYPGSVQTPIYDARQWVTRGVATAVIENHYDRTSGALSVYHNFGRHKINDGHAADKEPQTAYFRSDDALTGVSWYQSATLFQGNRITLGFDYQHIYGKAWNKVMATGKDLDPMGNEHDNEVAGYVDFRQDIASWLTVDAGVRVDNHSQTGTEWVPQGGLVFRVGDDSELKAMVSKGFRNPTIKEMYLWGMANDALRPERMINYELSWRQRALNGMLSYGLSLFYLKADNLIQTLMVDGRPKNLNTGEVENSGAELDFRWQLNPAWSINGNYSYLHMSKHLVGSPEHKAWLGAMYAHERWQINAGMQYVANLYTQTGNDDVKENFLLINATVGYKVLPQLTAWVKGENLLAQKYEINYGYPMPRATFMAGVNVSF